MRFTNKNLTLVINEALSMKLQALSKKELKSPIDYKNSIINLIEYSHKQFKRTII